MPLTYLQDYAGTIARSVSDLADLLNVTAGTDPQNPRTAEADANRPADWRGVLDPNALQGKRIGYVTAAGQGWNPPTSAATGYADSPTLARSRDAVDGLRAAGAEIVEIPTDVVAPPAGSFGDRNFEGWAQYIEAFPEVASVGIDDASDIVCSPRKLAYTQRTPADCAARTRMTPEQLAAWPAYRAAYKQAIADWMDANDVDAVVYPALYGEIANNDGGGNRPSFARRDTPSGGSGVPTVAFPVGTDADGNPVSLQLMGRAWSDGALVGMAYAYEQANGGHVEPTTAPALRYVPGAAPREVDRPVPVPSEPVVTQVQVPVPTPVPAGTPVSPIDVRLPSRATVGRSGRTRLVLRNADDQPVYGIVTLSGRVRVSGRVRTVRLGRSIVSLRAGQRRTVLVGLSRTARRALRGRASLRVRARFVLENVTGASRTTTRTVVLRPRR